MFKVNGVDLAPPPPPPPPGFFIVVSRTTNTRVPVHTIHTRIKHHYYLRTCRRHTNAIRNARNRRREPIYRSACTIHARLLGRESLLLIFFFSFFLSLVHSLPLATAVRIVNHCARRRFGRTNRRKHTVADRGVIVHRLPVLHHVIGRRWPTVRLRSPRVPGEPESLRSTPVP